MTTKRGCFNKLLLLIVLAGAAVAVAPLVPLSPLKHSVELKLSETLGRRVTIDSVRLSLLTSRHLIITQMIAHEDPVFGEGIFLTANEVRVGFDVIAYLRTRQIVFDSITLKSPEIDLVRNSDGVWSWTTLGKQSFEKSTATRLAVKTVSYSSILSLLPGGPVSASSFREIKIESASVKLRDLAGSEPSEVRYGNIVLNASLTPQTGDGSRRGAEAKGTLVMQSEEDGETDLLKGTLPFDLKIQSSDAAMPSVSGSIGPGSIETRNISIGEFAMNGEIISNRNAPLTGKGQMTANNLDIHSVNLSERVARALKLDQIGDMDPGTTVASLETDFQISQGTFQTTGLRIMQLDRLGDATAQSGSFRIDSGLVVNYAATVVLSPEATSLVKTMSPAIGLVVTILETNNRVSVPINVSGDVRNPEVQVDVSRIF